MSTKSCTPIALTSCTARLPSLVELFRRTELGQELLTCWNAVIITIDSLTSNAEGPKDP